MTPFELLLAGATKADDALARVWRVDLARTFGFRRPGDADYRCHTTLAHVHIWLPEDLMPAHHAGLADLLAGFVARVEVMDLT